MAGRCIVCHEPLEDAQWSNDKIYKSCPNCSTTNGKEHVYYPLEEFGFTDARITSNNPDGIQSWCQPCRGRGESASVGKLCSELKKR